MSQFNTYLTATHARQHLRCYDGLQFDGGLLLAAGGRCSISTSVGGNSDLTNWDGTKM